MFLPVIQILQRVLINRQKQRAQIELKNRQPHTLVTALGLLINRHFIPARFTAKAIRMLYHFAEIKKQKKLVNWVGMNSLSMNCPGGNVKTPKRTKCSRKTKNFGVWWKRLQSSFWDTTSFLSLLKDLGLNHWNEVWNEVLKRLSRLGYNHVLG